jgi:hypothetical protein
MEFFSTLAKMPAYANEEVHYLLNTDDDFVKMDYLLGRQISIEFLDQKICASCGGMFKSLFRMGFCRECFFSSPMAGESIVRPELSRAHEGIEDRDLAFEKSYQLQPHVVYLANSGGLKVGVTREKQKVNRWIDQGASSATVLAVTSNRYEAGMIEVELKQHLADKTVWQRMLKNEDPEMDLSAEKEKAAGLLSEEWKKFIAEDDEVCHLKYPVLHYPSKVKSINLDKDSGITAKLQGIRGQYLIFEGGGALNVRGHTGYRIKVAF